MISPKSLKFAPGCTASTAFISASCVDLMRSLYFCSTLPTQKLNSKQKQRTQMRPEHVSAHTLHARCREAVYALRGFGLRPTALTSHSDLHGIPCRTR